MTFIHLQLHLSHDGPSSTQPVGAQPIATQHLVSDTTVAPGHLPHLGVDTAQLDSLAVRQVVHGAQADVETIRRVVNSQDVDRPAVVRRRPARTTGGGVPSANGRGAADVGEVGDLALVLPAHGELC